LVLVIRLPLFFGEHLLALVGDWTNIGWFLDKRQRPFSTIQSPWQALIYYHWADWGETGTR
jgi:hypothetical protein